MRPITMNAPKPIATLTALNADRKTLLSRNHPLVVTWQPPHGLSMWGYYLDEQSRIQA